MALTKVMDGVTAVVDLAAAGVITLTGPGVVDAVGLKVREVVIVNKLMSDGVYHPLTNKDGAVVLSAIPNVAILEAAGLYKLTKPQVTAAVTCGYEEI